jgi:epoxide hydrolase
VDGHHVAVEPFRLAIPEADLDDLDGRLRRTRRPERETVPEDAQGIPLATVRALCEHWADGYDWRAAEARLNAIPQFRTQLDGLGIRFLHVRSPHASARARAR